METLIVVDVDGVLNVSIGDEGNAPIEFSVRNVNSALAKQDSLQSLSPATRACVERIASVHSRKPRATEGATYAELASEGNGLAEVAVGRLARLIQAAGERCTVVLSSTWRLPKHAGRLGSLEEVLSRHLGNTSLLKEDRTAEQRIRCIGDYVAGCCGRVGPGGNLRVVLLEDFHVRPMGSWTCDGLAMRSAADVEEYLCARAACSAMISAKLVHTYDEWVTEGGLHVQVGSGLTQAHTDDALCFILGASQSGEGLSVPDVEAGDSSDSIFSLFWASGKIRWGSRMTKPRRAAKRRATI